MKPCPVRSTLFNVLFLLLVGIECLICLPALLLPRRYFLYVVYGFVHSVHWLERGVLNLRYEIRGLENLPPEGSFIVAAKHQSAYETMKLHLLFKDPAVILKQELLSIPLWGQYLKKSDVIAIDRSTPEQAIQSIQDGARRMMAQGRPIVIFPQGTRVRIDQTPAEKPYKIGIARIQEATGLPIIPLALNTGFFWPSKGWHKSSGTVIFNFLKPLPAGLERKTLMSALEKTLETESGKLLDEAKEKAEGKTCCPIKRACCGKLLVRTFLLTLLVLFGLYTVAWFQTAKTLRAEYPKTIANLSTAMPDVPLPPPATPEISGYPGKIKLHVPAETLQTPDGTLKITDIRGEGWPIPFLPITLQTGPLEFQSFKWPSPFIFDRLFVRLTQKGKIIHVLDSALEKDSFKGIITGTVDTSQEPIPLMDLSLTLLDHPALFLALSTQGVLEERMALFVSAGLTALADKDGNIVVPLQQKDNTLYAGALPLMNIPQAGEDGAPVTPDAVETPQTPVNPVTEE